MLHTHQTNLKGFKAYLNYNKKEDLKPFGDLDINCFPLLKENDTFKKGSLQVFLRMLNTNVIDYLFNDAYVVILHKISTKNTNQKYINKQNKRNSKIKREHLKILW